MRIIPFILALLGLSTFCFSATIYVPDDFPNIQDAITASDDGDTVIVKPGTYVENVEFLGRAITVKSEMGPAATIINGSQSGSVISFKNAETTSSVLEGFTITNGSNCGIFCRLSSPTISHNVILGNTADYGGGIECSQSSSPTIMKNTISGNTANSYGGGIDCYELSSPIIINNTISGNTADKDGGGIYCLEISSPMITGNTISENTANRGGGGIHCWGNSSPVITDNSIVENISYLFGGGIACWEGSSPIILRNTISHNKTADRGGGIFTNNGSPTITNNFICGNLVFPTSNYGYGGGLYCKDGSPTITNNIIAGNDSNSGGGIYCSGYHEPIITGNTIAGNTALWGGGITIRTMWPTIFNTIFWGNSATNGPEIYDDSYGVVVTYCDVEGGWPGTGNIDSDPLFIAEGYWDDNDTPWDPTDDFWENGDYHLKWQSPCRDTGDNSAVTEPTDFEGDPRIALQTVDMGADEYYYHLYQVGDVIPGSFIDIRVVGYPTAPVTLYLGSGLADPPYSTQHGNFWLSWPPLWQGNIGTVPSDGVLVFPTTVPTNWTPGSEHTLQSLVGPWCGPWTCLTNVETLVVE